MNLDRIVRRKITMICFAEYACYVHFGDSDHIRFEYPTKIATSKDTFELFPNVDYRALRCLLGSAINDIKESGDVLELETDNGSIFTEINSAYESVMFVIAGESSVR